MDTKGPTAGAGGAPGVLFSPLTAKALYLPHPKAGNATCHTHALQPRAWGMATTTEGDDCPWQPCHMCHAMLKIVGQNTAVNASTFDGRY